MEQKTHYADDATLEYLLRIEREREELRDALTLVCNRPTNAHIANALSILARMGK